VLSLQGEREFLKEIRATAEHTLGLVLSLLRRLPAAARHVTNGGWSRDPFQGAELHGKTAGIVGYGRLGRIVARYLNAFGCEVLASDPHVDPRLIDPGVRLVSTNELLQSSHLVSLHVNLCAETKGIFGRAAFESMRQGSWFINTARGELVDEDALLDALHSGRLAGAALDVVRGEHGERSPQSPLIAYAAAHENLIITPHLGGCTAESMRKTEVFLAEKVRQRLLAENN
jgi:D-3-phosphoglycerate dehydrogenase